MLTAICQYLKNWFDYDSAHNRLKYWQGEITISNGKLQNIDLPYGQYFRIIDSLFNDGVHNTSDVLHDETFNGTVQSMKIPIDIINLSEDIKAWLNSAITQKAINSPYQSESILGVYSYSMGSASGTNVDGSTGISWTNQKQFRDRLTPWRKL